MVSKCFPNSGNPPIPRVCEFSSVKVVRESVEDSKGLSEDPKKILRIFQEESKTQWWGAEEEGSVCVCVLVCVCVWGGREEGEGRGSSGS